MSDFGRPLSTAIAVVGLSQIVSTVALTVAPQWGESFATMSNLAYVLSGCYHSFAVKPRSGSLASPAFPLLFLGVSSFAFHGEPVGHQQKHTLDILGGWMVVLHLGCTAMSAAVTELFSEIKMLRPYGYLVDFGFVICFSSGLLGISVMYSQVYSNQLLFYMVSAGAAVVFALAIRIRLANCKPLSVLIAVFESVAAFGIAISAVFLQGELVGRRLSYSSDKEMYNLMHGMWHVQLALVVSLLNVRYADVLEQTEQPLRSQGHINDVGMLDALGLAAFFLQSVILLVMKESGSPIVGVQVMLWVGSVIHGLHIGRLIYITWRPEKAIRTSSFRPLIGL